MRSFYNYSYYCYFTFFIWNASGWYPFLSSWTLLSSSSSSSSSVVIVPNMFITITDAYRIGESIDTELSINGQPSQDILHVQMPRFAISSQTQLSLSVPTTIQQQQQQQESRIHSITLSFEDGLWGMPAISSIEHLNRLDVQFVYSAGTIHAIHTEPHYNNNKKKDTLSQTTSSIQVHYIWMEEPQVHPEAGQTIMFMTVFIVTVLLLTMICGMNHDDIQNNHNITTTTTTHSQPSSTSFTYATIPKYE